MAQEVPSWCTLAPSRPHLGAILVHLSAILAHLGAILAPSWDQELPSWSQEESPRRRVGPKRRQVWPKRRQVGPKRRQLEPKRLPKASTEMTQTHRPRPHEFLCLSVQVFFCRPRFHKFSYIGKARMSFFLIGSTNFQFCAFTPNHYFTIDTAAKQNLHFFHLCWRLC